MAKERLPILQGKLSLPDRVLLANLTLHVGFPVLIRILETGMTDAQEDIAKADPEEEGYERKVIARQQRWRAINEYLNLVRQSVNYHVELAANEQKDNEVKAESESTAA